MFGKVVTHYVTHKMYFNIEIEWKFVVNGSFSGAPNEDIVQNHLT